MSLSVQKRAALLNWIKENLLPTATSTFHGVTSSDIQAAFYRSRNGFIVRESDVKTLMLECGFSVKNKLTPNWIFDVSPKSPAFIRSNVKVSEGEHPPPRQVIGPFDNSPLRVGVFNSITER